MRGAVYFFGRSLTATLAVPSASAVTRSVFESNSMPVRRRSLHDGLDPHAVAVLLEVGQRRVDLGLGVGGERFQIEHRVVGQRLLQIGHGRARGGAEQAEGRFRFHRQREIGEAEDLRVC